MFKQVSAPFYIKNPVYFEGNSLQNRPEILASYLIVQFPFKLPHYLNPVPRIDNDLFYQLFFHVLCQFFLFQKDKSLIRFPLGAFLFGLFFFLCLPERCKFFFQFPHIGIILSLFVQEELSFQFPIGIFIIQRNPAFLCRLNRPHCGIDPVSNG